MQKVGIFNTKYVIMLLNERRGHHVILLTTLPNPFS